MDIIQQVFDVSNQALAIKPYHVTINNDAIDILAENMKNTSNSNTKEEGYKTGIELEVVKELVASSINYCYWYGAHDIRPNGVSSTTMYNDLNFVFDTNGNALMIERKIYELIALLSINRYPLIEERKRHLLELCEGRKAETFVDMIIGREYSADRLFHEMIEMFQGFASDIFLKRASLFFIQLYRKFGWYKNDLMTILHVPADYQVPKILKYFDCIQYSEELEKKIMNGVLIPKHSIEELQIRAATVKVCTELQYKTGWTIADVDTYLWTKRKLTDEPFHLTITTDY